MGTPTMVAATHAHPLVFGFGFAPQCGQAVAVVLMSFLHSWHFVIAMGDLLSVWCHALQRAAVLPREADCAVPLLAAQHFTFWY